MNNNPKSATVAGLLGIFLGGVGAHNWYLGEKKKGIIHLSLLGGAILLMVLADAILPAVLSLRAALTMAGLFLLLNGVAGLILSGNSLWGFIEGIIILSKGDAGLAQQGIPTASVPAAQQPMVQQNWQGGAGYAAQGSNGSDGAGQGGASADDMGAGLAGYQPGAMQSGATSQPVMQAKPPKQPMDPAKKKKIIRGVVIGAVAIVAVTVAAIVMSALMRVDYSEAYKIAKELKPEVVEMYQNTSCSRVVEYVNSTYTKPADYNEYAEKCLAAGSEIDSLTKKLGETAGVKRNKEVKAQFDRFSEGVSATLPDKDQLEKKLAMYKAWHEFDYLRDDLTNSSPDSTVQAAAAPLINSGNETLKAYGEGWQTSVLAVTQAYREYDNLSYSDSNKSAARLKYQNLQADHNNWVAANKPDIKTLGGLSFENNSKMYSEWTKLYNLIRDTYEENYNSGSGDCSELFGEVYCD